MIDMAKKGKGKVRNVKRGAGKRGCGGKGLIK